MSRCGRVGQTRQQPPRHCIGRVVRLNMRGGGSAQAFPQRGVGGKGANGSRQCRRVVGWDADQVFVGAEVGSQRWKTLFGTT